MITRKPTSKAQTTELSDVRAAEAPFKLRRASFKGNGRPPEFEGASWDQLRDAVYPLARCDEAPGQRPGISGALPK